MIDMAEHKPKNRSYFSFRTQIGREELMPLFLAVAAYLVTMGIGCLLYPR